MITYYTGFGAQKINSAIAPGDIHKIQHEMDILDQALMKGVIPQDITVVRKTIPEYLNYFSKGYRPSVEEMFTLRNRVLTNNIYTSTTLEPFEYFRRNVEIHIHVPKGYKDALYLHKAISFNKT